MLIAPEERSRTLRKGLRALSDRFRVPMERFKIIIEEVYSPTSDI